MIRKTRQSIPSSLKQKNRKSRKGKSRLRGSSIAQHHKPEKTKNKNRTPNQTPIQIQTNDKEWQKISQRGKNEKEK